MAVEGRSEGDLTFWMAFIYWSGLVAALAFSGYVSWQSSFPWYTESTTMALLSMVFHGTLLFLGLTFGLLIVYMARKPEGTAIDEPGEGSSEEDAAAPSVVLSRSLKQPLLSTIPLAAVLAALSLSGVGGSSWVPRNWFALNNFLVVFGLLGLLVLLFPGLGYVFLSALRSHGAKGVTTTVT